MSEPWHDRSFFLEMKPRADLASLFVDCPPNGEGDENESNCLDLVRVSENTVELGIPPIIADRIAVPKGESARFCARLAGLFLSPDSVCSPTWADNKRLFMCKVRAGVDKNHPLTPKQFHRLAKEMCPVAPLEKFAEYAEGKTVDISCEQCGLKVVQGSAGSISLGWLPADDFLLTTPSVDYYCRDTCGAACDPQRHSHSHGDRIENQPVHSEWQPTSRRIMISHSHSIVHSDTLVSDRICLENKHIFCAGCHAELGSELKNNKHLLVLHHAVATLAVNDKSYISYRFPNRSMFFTQLLLSSCEAKSSLKLVVRSLDKTPHLLVWLLDSYVLLASGDLQERKEDVEIDSVKPFPAIKMLYKVFDAETAASDPRANGEDASVGLIDLPLSCCIQLIEALLTSSHALPPACRSVGQFYVGFLRLADEVEK